jgi:uncharacterized protein
MGDLHFEWNEAKNEANAKKHGVSFEEAQTVFFDEDAFQVFDPEHSDQEDRFLLIGRSFHRRVLMVCHCFRSSEEIIRIISARKATARERNIYRKRTR